MARRLSDARAEERRQAALKKRAAETAKRKKQADELDRKWAEAKKKKRPAVEESMPSFSAPAAAPQAQTYVVKSGDSLSKIAKAHYGDAMKYPVIFEANKPMLQDPDKIYPGQVLRIPEL